MTMTTIVRHDQPPVHLPIIIGHSWCEFTVAGDHAGPEMTVLCPSFGVAIRARNLSEDEEHDHLAIDRLQASHNFSLEHVRRCRVMWIDGQTLYRIDFSDVAVTTFSRPPGPAYVNFRAFGILAGVGQPMPTMHGHNTEPPYNLGMSSADAEAIRAGMARPADAAFFDEALGLAYVPSPPPPTPVEGEGEDETYTVEVERDGSSSPPIETGVGILGETLTFDNIAFASIAANFVRHLSCHHCAYRVQLTRDFVEDSAHEFRWENFTHYARCPQCLMYDAWTIHDVPRADPDVQHLRLDHDGALSLAWCGAVGSSLAIVRRPDTRHRPGVCPACVEAYKQAVSNQLAALQPPPPKAPRRLDLNP